MRHQGRVLQTTVYASCLLGNRLAIKKIASGLIRTVRCMVYQHVRILAIMASQQVVVVAVVVVIVVTVIIYYA